MRCDRAGLRPAETPGSAQTVKTATAPATVIGEPRPHVLRHWLHRRSWEGRAANGRRPESQETCRRADSIQTVRHRRSSAHPYSRRTGCSNGRAGSPACCKGAFNAVGKQSSVMTRRFWVLFALLLCAAAPPAASAAAPPRRIVSLNLCADQLVVLLAEPERIAALSKLARDRSLSYVAERADAFPIVQPYAESVLAHQPDLVLAGRLSATPTVQFLQAKGVPVLQINLLSSFDAIREQTRSVGRALGAAEKAEKLVAEMDAVLAADDPPALDAPHRRPGRPRPVALTWQPGGFTAGSGTLVDAVLQAAGYDNMAALNGLKGYGFLTLEAVAAGKPDLLISDPAVPDPPSLRHALLAHPALKPSAEGVGARTVTPPPLTACAGPFTAQAVALLRAKRRELGL